MIFHKQYIGSSNLSNLDKDREAISILMEKVAILSLFTFMQSAKEEIQEIWPDLPMAISYSVFSRVHATL